MTLDNLYKILPSDFSQGIKKRLNLERLYEIRFRTGRPAMVNYGGKYYYLTRAGLKDSADSECYEFTASDINDVVVKASEHSLYAVNDQLCSGFITVKGGIRLGVSGETVSENGTIKTVKNYSSVNIRIPHEVKGCGDGVYDFIAGHGVHNTLIISPPGAGKTTLLRDLARIIGNSLPVKNVLIADERSELAAANKGDCALDVGRHTDVISNATKQFTFAQGIRSMRPDVIITDELMGTSDLDAVENACASGVSVLASVHARDHIDLALKPGFEEIIKKRLFKRFICLSDKQGPGTTDSIFDENFSALYYP